MSFVIGGNNPVSTGYTLTRSLRTRASASAYLNRTFATPTNSGKWTFSAWIKRGAISSEQGIFGNGSSSTAGALEFLNTDTLRLAQGATQVFITTQVFRDPSAWYHILLAVDTSASGSNKLLLYVNGAQVTSFSTDNRSSFTSSTFNTAILHEIGYYFSTSYTFDGYLAEVNFIDGQALTPSSFGSTNALTGVWQPAAYTGTYGTNGFYLPFTDNSALTTSSNVGLGKDFSGNGNYWVTNNISITAGVTYDSMTDVPTLTSATAANFCTWNPVAQSTVVNGTVTRSNGNLTSTDGGTTYGLASFGTIASTTGKFYWEVTLSAAGDVYANIGVVDLNSPLGAGGTHTGIVYAQLGTKNSGSGAFASGGGGPAYGASYTVGDVIGVALDLTAGTITFYKNGTSQGVAYTGISGNYTPAVGDGANATSYTFNLNCGQRPFTYTPPTGFVALNTYNLPDSTIVKGNTVMDATLWTGTGAIQPITNAAGFKPDLLWVKGRSRLSFHDLVDSVRGVNLALSSNSTNAEITGSFITSLNSNGFTLPANTTSDTYFTNVSGDTMVGWQWQAGQGSSSSNTNGTITSTVSVNASAGFSVVTYTGNGTAGATIGHGLGVAPAFIINKSRSAVISWAVYHSALTGTAGIFLDQTTLAVTNSGYWNNTNPTSSVFSIGNSTLVNVSSQTQVAYCWAEIAGFSKFGIYTGNGSTDGVFVFTPFRPKFVIIKRTDATGDWYTFDTIRDPYNATAQGLSPNSAAVEASYTGWGDLLSNGFKIRRTDAAWNASGGTYIYMAFAESPFRNALAR